MLHEIFSFVASHIDIKIIWYILLFPFVAFWIWSVLYVTRDISHRTDNTLYQIFMILLVAVWTPLVWFPLYFIFRPFRPLDDIIWRRSLEAQSIECLDCGSINYKDNNFCVDCGSNLKTECKECKNKYYSWNDYCPNCGAPNIDITE